MIRILAVSDGFDHFKEPIEVYKKRLKNIGVEIYLVRPEHEKDIALVRKKESLKIESILKKEKSYVIYCDILGETFETNTFCEHIFSLIETYRNVYFVIGGAFGIDRTILSPYIREYFSFGPQTFPHSLALLMLLEQIYRIDQIKRNTSYHH